MTMDQASRAEPPVALNQTAHMPSCEPQHCGTRSQRSDSSPDLSKNPNTMQLALVHQYQTHANPPKVPETSQWGMRTFLSG
jgi:hypothetical protein